MTFLPLKWKRSVRDCMRALAGPRIVILLYHRVSEPKRDPWGMCVAPDRFLEHLEVLQSKKWPVMHLAELPERLSAKNCPRRAVAITFDDGYADNLHHAAPLLERFAMPATVAVTSGAVDGEREFWWDELERLLLEPEVLPERLDLEVAGRRRSWGLEEAALRSVDDASWRAWERPPTARHALYVELWHALYPVPTDEKDRLLNNLAQWTGLPSYVRPTHRSLSSSELRALAGTGLVEVGAHTIGHTALSDLPPTLQRREIVDSKRQLEAWLDAPVSSFSYPHGAYDAFTRELVRKAGFLRACSTVRGLVRPNAEAFSLPRVEVQNWDADTFARQLDTVMLK